MKIEPRALPALPQLDGGPELQPEAASALEALLAVTDRREPATAATTALPPGQPQRLEDLLLQGGPGGLELGRATAALAAFLARPPRAQESDRLRRLRELLGRLVALRQAAGEGLARIQVG
jgi:hypothetical protein